MNNGWFEERSQASGAHMDRTMAEKHYTVGELAVMWGLSMKTVRRLFQHEPGVLRMGAPETRSKRPYITLRIPESTVERVYNRLIRQAEPELRRS